MLGTLSYTLWLNFSAKKAGAVFVDLTEAYNTVWHRGLICKLLRLLPDWHKIRMIMELVGNRSFTLKANLHWGVARCTRARFFVCFVASGNSVLAHGLARQLLGAVKQTKNCAGLLLATPQCRLVFTIGNGKRSRLRRLRNGVLESVLASLLFNIFSDLPTTVSRKYAYVEDLALMHADRNR